MTCLSCIHCGPFCDCPGLLHSCDSHRSLPAIIKHPAHMNCSCLKCDWPESENKQPWISDTALANWFALLVVELFWIKQCVTAVSSHFTLCSSPHWRCSWAYDALRKETIAQDLVIALVFSIIVNVIVLHPSYRFRQAFTFRTRCSRLNNFSFPELILASHFSICPSSTFFNLAAFIANVGCFPCINNVVELLLSAIAFALFRATLVLAICTRILSQSRLSTLN